MSRRFGRNQKRAMRSALAELGKKLEHSQKNVESLHQQMHTNEMCLRLVARILGDDFVGLEPRTIQMDTLDRPYFHPPRMDPQRLISCMHPGQLADAVAYSVLEIEPNRARVAYYEEQIRFRFITPAGDVSYGMSRQAWDRMPKDEQEHMLRGEIAHSMANHLIKSRRS